MQGVDYIGLLEALHREIAPKVYVEIGVESPARINMSSNVAIGIAPHPSFTGMLNENVQMFDETSADFFLKNDLLRYTCGRPIDLALLDGVHLFENTLQDFMNVEKYSHPATVVCIHDVLPQTARMAMREPQPDGWTGDVFGIAIALRQHRPDLFVVVLNVPPTGMLLISNLDAPNTKLHTDFQEICAEHACIDYDEIHSRQSEILKPIDFSSIFIDYLKSVKSLNAELRNLDRLKRIIKSDLRVQFGYDRQTAAR